MTWPVRETRGRQVPACVLAVAVAMFAGRVSFVAQTTAPELQFDASADWLKTPDDIFLGPVAGVGTNSKGHVFVYTRTGHPYATLGDNRTFSHGGSRLLQFDQSGKFVRELGQDVYGFNAAIGLRVDPQDNVWTIDQAASQVVKFDSDGRVALVLGRKPEAIAVRPNQPAGGGGRGGDGPAPPAAAGGVRGGNGPAPAAAAGGRAQGAGTPGSSFGQPSDVAWDRAGNIYVADGIGANNRIAKFDKDGRFLLHWGSTGSGPGQFTGAKAIAVDAQDNVYVADIGNRRIQVFDAQGTFKSEFSSVGRPRALCITRGATPYLYVAHAGDDDGMEDGAIYKLQLNGTVVGRLGSAGKLPKQFGIVNSIDCRNENELLVGEMTNWRVQKITVRR